MTTKPSKPRAEQLDKNCKILQWLEAADPELARAYEDVCGTGWLMGRRAGVTFLYPSESSVREHICGLRYSNGDQAETVLKSLIIPEALHTGGDFGKHEVGNMLDIKLKVLSASGKKVSIDGDGGACELELVTDFKVLKSREGRMAIWKITGKVLPPTSGAEFHAERKPRERKEGGGDARHRLNLALSVEQQFDACMRRDRCASRNPYLAKSVSLLSYLRTCHPAEYAKVLPVADYDPAVTFYLLVEPYKRDGDFLLADEVLFGDGGWNGAEVFKDAVAEYKAHFESLASDSSCVATAQRAAVIDRIRKDIGTNGKNTVPSAIIKAYEVLTTQNSVGGLAPILPASTLAAVGGAKKLWQDEVRHLLHSSLGQCVGTPDYAACGAAEFANVRHLLAQCWPGNDYLAEISMNNLEKIKGKIIVNGEEHAAVVQFMCSTDFLYVAVPPAQVGAPTQPTKSVVLINRNANALKSLDRYSGMVCAAGIDAAALAALQMYKAMYGALPHGL